MCGQCTALHACADHNRITEQGFKALLASQVHKGRRAVGRCALHRCTVQRVHTQTCASLCQAVGVFVDVACGVTLGEVATVVASLQRGLYGAHFIRRDGAAFQTTRGQQLRHFARMLEARLVAVDMQDALALVVEVNAFFLGPAKQVLARGNGQARGGNGVVAVFGYGGHKLGHPADLVPGGRGVHQQGRVFGEHPFQAFDDGAGVGPDLGIRRGQLAAIGVGRFHPRVAVFLDQGYAESGFGKRVGAGDAGDAATDDGDVFLRLGLHGWHSSFRSCRKQRSRPPHTMCGKRPPLFAT